MTSSPGTPLRVRPFGNPISSPSRRRSGVFYLPSAENTSTVPLFLSQSSGLLSPRQISVISLAETRLPADPDMSRREPRVSLEALLLTPGVPLPFYLCPLSFEKTQKKMRTLGRLLRTCSIIRSRGPPHRWLIIINASALTFARPNLFLFRGSLVQRKTPPRSVFVCSHISSSASPFLSPL